MVVSHNNCIISGFREKTKLRKTRVFLSFFSPPSAFFIVLYKNALILSAALPMAIPCSLLPGVLYLPSRPLLRTNCHIILDCLQSLVLAEHHRYLQDESPNQTAIPKVASQMYLAASVTSNLNQNIACCYPRQPILQIHPPSNAFIAIHQIFVQRQHFQNLPGGWADGQRQIRILGENPPYRREFPQYFKFYLPIRPSAHCSISARFTLHCFPILNAGSSPDWTIL